MGFSIIWAVKKKNLNCIEDVDGLLLEKRVLNSPVSWKGYFQCMLHFRPSMRWGQENLNFRNRKEIISKYAKKNIIKHFALLT